MPKKKVVESDEELSDFESGSDYNDTPKKKPKAKAKTTSRTTKSKVIEDDSDEAEVPTTTSKKTTNTTKKDKDQPAIEDIYQKKTQLEHILLRPDTYIGSTEHTKQELWVVSNGRFVYKNINYVPGLYKIFDELLVNAADNKQRDDSMDTIKVTIDKEKGSISVWNNGKGIPVEIHKKYDIYVPELIFGHLLTSSNYDDSEKKVTGGRNGFGAKLANIFSTEFIVETVDSERGKKFVQVFKNNMSEKSAPKITSSSNRKDYTCITFKPDLEKFHMTELDDDIISLLTKRVYDIAGTTDASVKVTLNGEKLPIKKFSDYVKLYPIEGTLVYEEPHERWQVGIALTSGNEFQQVSFVNSICTIRGGKHVQHVIDPIVKTIQESIAKKNKSVPMRPQHIKSHLFVFINSLIENPSFDSQTKETLTLNIPKFGSKCVLSEKFHKQVISKSGIIDKLLEFARTKEVNALKKTSGTKKKRLTGISKLDDANDAGGRYADKCTLILTEGDSAKALAVSGLSVVGRDRYGVFPLKGKLLNVRDATFNRIQANEEITTLLKIIGLQHSKEYTEESIKTLRYGSIMIMADQDHDGSHIKGLVINFIHRFWPSLLRVPGFMKEFITPIIKARRGRQVKSFFTIQEFKQWREENNGAKGWEIKYYKGLGTSTSQEAREYFSNLDIHQVTFEYDGDEADKSILLAFDKKRADDRKQWLENYKAGEQQYIDTSAGEITYSDFFNKELIQFSIADCERSIPSIVDGMKPGQRKILFSCFKRKSNKEIKVAQLSGLVAKVSAYHHGEASLQGTIVGMAQDFVGSNNINLLVPSGQFGTRLQGGKDAASARYIHTKLADISRYLFKPEDDAILHYLDDDGLKVEPKWYVPVIPTVLINGSDGIGTAWSTSIPNFNPREIVDNIRRLIRGEPMVEITPWYKGFKGTISYVKAGTYQSYGVCNKIDDSTLEITELPLHKWTQDYKKFIEDMLPSSEGEGWIEDFRENHTDTSVHFTLTLKPSKLAEIEKIGFIKHFKLSSYLHTSNMTLFNRDGQLKQYKSPLDIIQEFYEVRLAYYRKRKDFLVDKLRNEYEKLSNKARFVLAVIDGDIVVSKRKKADLVKELAEKGFKQFPSKRTKRTSAVDDSNLDNDSATEDDDEEEVDADDGGDVDSSDDDEDDGDVKKKRGVKKEPKVKKAKMGPLSPNAFDYLLSMPLWNLTMEKVEELLKEKDKKEAELEALIKTTEVQLWERDLDQFVAKLDEVEEQERLRDAGATKNGRSTATRGRGRGRGRGRAATTKASTRKAPPKRKKTDDSESEAETDSDASDFEEKPKPKAKATTTKKTVIKAEPIKSETEQSDSSTTKKSTTAAKKTATTAKSGTTTATRSRATTQKNTLDAMFSKAKANGKAADKSDTDMDDVTTTTEVLPKGSLSERLAKSGLDVSAIKKRKTTATKKKQQSEDSGSDSGSESEGSDEDTTTTASKKKASTATAKKRTRAASVSDEDNESDAAAKKSTATTTAAKRRRLMSTNKDTNDNDDSNSESESEPESKSKAKPKTTTTTKAANKKARDDDAEDDDNASESDAKPKRSGSQSKTAKSKASDDDDELIMLSDLSSASDNDDDSDYAD